MGLLSALFRYTPSPGRTPLEDFLTECLCHLLRLLNDYGCSGEAASRLLEIGGLEGASLDWQTQYRIPPSAGSAVSGKRPDLVAEGTLGTKDVFLIVENKVSAGFTETLDAETGELQSQLHIYGLFLKRQPHEIKALRLLTHDTPPPPHW